MNDRHPEFRPLAARAHERDLARGHQFVDGQALCAHHLYEESRYAEVVACEAASAACEWPSVGFLRLANGKRSEATVRVDEASKKTTVTLGPCRFVLPSGLTLASGRRLEVEASGRSYLQVYRAIGVKSSEEARHYLCVAEGDYRAPSDASWKLDLVGQFLLHDGKSPTDLVPCAELAATNEAAEQITGLRKRLVQLVSDTAADAERCAKETPRQHLALLLEDDIQKALELIACISSPRCSTGRFVDVAVRVVSSVIWRWRSSKLEGKVFHGYRWRLDDPVGPRDILSDPCDLFESVREKFSADDGRRAAGLLIKFVDEWRRYHEAAVTPLQGWSYETPPDQSTFDGLGNASLSRISNEPDAAGGDGWAFRELPQGDYVIACCAPGGEGFRVSYRLPDREAITLDCQPRPEAGPDGKAWWISAPMEIPPGCDGVLVRLPDATDPARVRPWLYGPAN